jgi:hypothetical protein
VNFQSENLRAREREREREISWHPSVLVGKIIIPGKVNPGSKEATFS